MNVKILRRNSSPTTESEEIPTKVKLVGYYFKHFSGCKTFKTLSFKCKNMCRSFPGIKTLRAKPSLCKSMEHFILETIKSNFKSNTMVRSFL